jgi:hypothetical protein
MENKKKVNNEKLAIGPSCTRCTGYMFWCPDKKYVFTLKCAYCGFTQSRTFYEKIKNSKEYGKRDFNPCVECGCSTFKKKSYTYFPDSKTPMVTIFKCIQCCSKTEYIEGNTFHNASNATNTNAGCFSKTEDTKGNTFHDVANTDEKEIEKLKFEMTKFITMDYFQTFSSNQEKEIEKLKSDIKDLKENKRCVSHNEEDMIRQLSELKMELQKKDQLSQKLAENHFLDIKNLEEKNAELKERNAELKERNAELEIRAENYLSVIIKLEKRNEKTKMQAENNLLDLMNLESEILKLKKENEKFKKETKLPVVPQRNSDKWGKDAEERKWGKDANGRKWGKNNNAWK